MIGKTVRMRVISIAVLVTFLVCVASGLITKQLEGSSGIAAVICFAIGMAVAGRIGFWEIPTNRLWILFWLPIALSAYAIIGFMCGRGHQVSWAVIALAYIAGGRAANLNQMLRDGL